MLVILPNGCQLDVQQKEGIIHVINPDQCPDKELVKYLNCNGLQIQNMQKKECQ